MSTNSSLVVAWDVKGLEGTLSAARSNALRFVRKHPFACASAAIAVVALLVAGWVAWDDFRSYQNALKAASSGAFTNAKDLREIDIQEHIAGFTYGVLLFAAFSFVISLGALVFLGWTLRETSSMALDTRNMVQQTAEDAEESRRLNHAQYRAYVRAEEAHLYWRNERWEIKVKYRNDGQSPALYIHHRVEVRIRHERRPRPDDDVLGGVGFYDSKRPLPPGADEEFHYPVPDFEHAQGLGAREVATFIGDVVYRDIFGNWIRTEFEFYLDEIAAVAWINKSVPIKLEWGRRGPGGVYEPVDLDTEPSNISAFLATMVNSQS